VWEINSDELQKALDWEAKAVDGDDTRVLVKKYSELNYKITN